MNCVIKTFHDHLGFPCLVSICVPLLSSGHRFYPTLWICYFLLDILSSDRMPFSPLQKALTWALCFFTGSHSTWSAPVLYSLFTWWLLVQIFTSSIYCEHLKPGIMSFFIFCIHCSWQWPSICLISIKLMNKWTVNKIYSPYRHTQKFLLKELSMLENRNLTAYFKLSGLGMWLHRCRQA